MRPIDEFASRAGGIVTGFSTELKKMRTMNYFVSLAGGIVTRFIIELEYAAY